MKVLIIFNREPYDNTDVTWNGLRLAETLRASGNEIRYPPEQLHFLFPKVSVIF